ncbi:hypothetical protein SAY86_025676 [Trapa natans]|uniref:Myb-like domain-containing protein n=1 Tax=Trapa natans TaxID=22666 RepID=A0AAN7KIF5_TRANT|nr:hypothetical protein SAY86_025676 [Trapa natans]
MDNMEDDARYPPNPRGGSQLSGYGSTANGQKQLTAHNMPYSGTHCTQYTHDEVDDDEEDDDEEMGDGVDVKNPRDNGIREGTNGLDDEEDEDDFHDEDEDDDNSHLQNKFGGSAGDSDRRRKKRKLKSLVLSYEFAPRVPAPQEDSSAVAALSSGVKPSFGGRNGLTDWTEAETFVLLDAWGDRFLQHGRKSLRSEEWQEVADKVSEVSKIERTDAQCRNRLDTLKKKYKKEKLKLTDGGSNGPSKWVYFRKMDTLMSSPLQKQSSVGGLSCGVDSGEYIFTNPRVYLNRANGMDEMRDSPGNSEFSNRDEDEDDSDGLPPKKRRSQRESNGRSSFKLLADSIFKFSDMYERMEKRKSQQMVEIERMRMEFQRDLEVQRRQIMERAHAEIAKIMEYNNEENNDRDHSGENVSG